MTSVFSEGLLVHAQVYFWVVELDAWVLDRDRAFGINFNNFIWNLRSLTLKWSLRVCGCQLIIIIIINFFVTFANYTSYVAQNVVLVGCVARWCDCGSWAFTAVGGLHSSWLCEHPSVHRSWHGFVSGVLQAHSIRSIVRVTYVQIMFMILRRMCDIHLFWRKWWKLQFATLLFQDNCVHPIYGSVSVATREELFTLDSACDNITNQRVFLWKIGCEIHLLPLVLFSDTQPWESEVWTDSCSFNEVKEAIYETFWSKENEKYLPWGST